MDYLFLVISLFIGLGSGVFFGIKIRGLSSKNLSKDLEESLSDLKHIKNQKEALEVEIKELQEQFNNISKVNAIKENEIKNLNTKNNDLSSQLENQEKKNFDNITHLSSKHQKEFERLESKHKDEITSLKNDQKGILDRYIAERDDYRSKFDELVSQLSDVEKREEGLKKEKESLENSAKELKGQISQMSEIFTKKINESKDSFAVEFENLSNKIFSSKTKEFTNHSSESFKNLIAPLKENLNEFKVNLNNKLKDNNSERYQLKNQLNNIIEMNSTLSSDAQNLTDALRGNFKAQGTWGELQLKKVLDMSGLKEEIDYKLQGKGFGVKNEQGNSKYPDVVVLLPQNRHVIIDSKIVLNSYQDYINADTKQERETHLKEYIACIKKHVKNLSETAYHDYKQFNSPDFTLMFIANEGAFSLAIEKDPQLFTDAWSKKIIMVGPTNLFATLKVIENVWKSHKQEENINKIIKQATSLYDKFYSLMTDIQKIGSQLNTVQKTYKQILIKSSGKQGLVKQMQKLEDLGVKGKKELSSVESKFLSHDEVSINDNSYDELETSDSSNDSQSIVQNGHIPKVS